MRWTASHSAATCSQSGMTQRPLRPVVLNQSCRRDAVTSSGKRRHSSVQSSAVRISSVRPAPRTGIAVASSQPRESSTRFNPAGMRPTVRTMPCGNRPPPPGPRGVRVAGALRRRLGLFSAFAACPMRPAADAVPGSGAGSDRRPPVDSPLLPSGVRRPTTARPVTLRTVPARRSRAARTQASAARTSSPSGCCQYLAVSTARSRASWILASVRPVESRALSAAASWFSEVPEPEAAASSATASSPETIVSSTRDVPRPESRSYPSRKTMVLMSGSNSMASSRHSRRPRGPSRSTSPSPASSGPSSHHWGPVGCPNGCTNRCRAVGSGAWPDTLMFIPRIPSPARSRRP